MTKTLIWSGLTTHGCVAKEYNIMLLVPNIPVRSGCCSLSRLCVYGQIINAKTADLSDSV